VKPVPATNHPGRISHTLSTAVRDKAASTALRLPTVLTVLFKYASARWAARALWRVW